MPAQPLVAIYCRVSTKESLNEQNPENQAAPLREWCKKNHYAFEEFIEYESGAEVSNRPQFQKMVSNLDKYDGIAIVSPERLSRNPADYIVYIHRIIKAGKWLYISARNLTIDKSTPKTVLATLGFEYQASALFLAILSDSTKAGIERKRKEAEAKGIPFHWGRKPLHIKDKTTGKFNIIIDPAEVKALHNKGYSTREIGRELDIPKSTVQYIITPRQPKAI